MQCDYISREKSRQIEGSILVLRNGPTELSDGTTSSYVTFPQAENPIETYCLIDKIGNSLVQQKTNTLLQMIEIESSGVREKYLISRKI